MYRHHRSKTIAHTKAHTGGNEYATKVQKDLNQLAKDDKDLGSRIGTLDKSKQMHTIGMTENPDDGNVNTPVSQSNDENGIPTGSNTKNNPDKETNVRGDKRVARAGLAHELLEHGYDSDQGKADYSKTDNGIPMYEVNAVNMENRARAAAGDPKKATYGGKQYQQIYCMIHTKRKSHSMKIILALILSSCTMNKDTSFYQKVINDPTLNVVCKTLTRRMALPTPFLLIR